MSDQDEWDGDSCPCGRVQSRNGDLAFDLFNSKPTKRECIHGAKLTNAVLTRTQPT